MSVGEKFELIADKVYAVGVTDGQKSEYDKFWDSFQKNGTRTNYTYGFYLWTDTAYNPKYKITITSGSATFQNTSIYDTKVDVDVSGSANTGQLFNNSTVLHTIRKLIVSENNTTFSGWFTSCSKLENLTIEGVVGKNISFVNSPLLSNDSIQSIVNALKDLTGQTTAKVTFHSTVLTKLTGEQADMIAAKNWNVG